MTYAELLRENKDRFIDSNPNLTLNQKSEIKNYFRNHSAQEALVDWNKSNLLTYDDFSRIMKKVSRNAQKRYRIFEVTEGKDYISLGYSSFRNRRVELYEPLTWKGSCALASNQFGPEIWCGTPAWNGDDVANSWGKEREDNLKPGAKWCISMHTTKDHWNDYVKYFMFLFIFDPSNPVETDRKIAISITKLDKSLDAAYNAEDENILISPYIDIITSAIPDMELPARSMPGKFKFNPQTGRYDIDNSYGEVSPEDFVDNGRIIAPIGRYIGDLSLQGYSTPLVSLENLPTEIIEGSLHIALQEAVTSLEGLPKRIDGSLTLSRLNVTSLEGITPSINGSLDISYLPIKNLRGAENISVKESIHITDCPLLESLEGFPEVKHSLFLENNNNLESLKGLPEVLPHYFMINHCGLERLEGCPRLINGGFVLMSTLVKNLVGGPKEVTGTYVCRGNKLVSLQGIAKKIKGDLVVEEDSLREDDPFGPDSLGGHYSGKSTEGTKDLPTYSQPAYGRPLELKRKN